VLSGTTVSDEFLDAVGERVLDLNNTFL